MDKEEHLKTTSSHTSTPEYYRERIKIWLDETSFKKKFFGGIDEADVWRKLQELEELYEEALRLERVRYDELLAAGLRCGNGGADHEA